MPAKRFPEQDAQAIASAYAALAATQAVVIGGSVASGIADERSDLDVYVYCSEVPDQSARNAIAFELGTDLELDERLWEPSDQWRMRESGLHVDVIFRRQTWIGANLDATLRQAKASLGYSTSLWHNVIHSQVLFDRSGWFADILRQCNVPYPAALRDAIIAKNFPILGSAGFSFLHQLELAVQRNDSVSVVHRSAAFLASYFDVLFAANLQPHPGEKRMLQHAHNLCTRLPDDLTENIEAIALGGQSALKGAVSAEANLRSLLRNEGLLPPRGP